MSHDLAASDDLSMTHEPWDAAFSAERRRQLAKEGKALPDGSYPIVNERDLRNAIQAYGRASDLPRARRHIIKRARALGATALLPDAWKDTASQDEAKVKLYYFAGRNTPIAASSAAEAKRKKKRGGDAIVKVREPTAAERKAMRRGDWVRTRRDGKSPQSSQYGKGRGYGPPRKDSAMDDAQKDDKKKGYRKKKKDSGSLEFACEHCDRQFVVERVAQSHVSTVHGE